MMVLGLDIVKGNPLSRTSPPMYSAVVVDADGKIVTELLEASLNTIIRLVWEYSINRIGIDNIYELAPTSKDIARILSLFPSYTEIYQVTLENNVFTNVILQASKIGISLHSKPKPIQTAYICALLALNNIGTPIKGLERKTKIIVTRTRSMGSGGSSANRYIRGMRVAILRAVKEIKLILEKEKLDYDVVIRKSFGGLDSAIFTVYADSETVRSIIKPYKGKDIRIVIKPVYSDIITLHYDDKKRKPLIVGIDPGIETGIAIIDLSLNILLIESSKSLDRLDIIDKIYHYGIPVLIAVDKNPPPENVKKIASILGAQLYVPNESLTIEMKDRLIEWLKRKKHTDIKINTTHERDALAAALRAYKAYERKLLELEKRLLEMGIDVDIDELKSMLLKGYNISSVIEYAIDKYLNSISDECTIYCASTNSISSYSKQPIYCDDKVKTLESKIADLTKENEVLRNRLRETESKINELMFEKRFAQNVHLDAEVQRERAFARLSEQIKQLQNIISNLKEEVEKLTQEKNEYLNLISMLATRKIIIVPRLRTLSISSLNTIKDLVASSKMLIIDNDAVSYDVLDNIKQTKVILLFERCSPKTEQLFIDNSIPVICGISIRKIGDIFGAVDIDELEKALLSTIGKLYLHQKAKAMDLSDIIKIISEYRSNIISKTST